MEQLIDKSALVAEIERRMRHHIDLTWTDSGYRHALFDVLAFIHTLEVKEVDLEKYYHDFLQKEWFDGNHARTVSGMMFFTAKHFYELGLKAQKGE